MKYISVFSGIGGLEHSSIAPIIACDTDSSCKSVLSRRFPDTHIHDDVENLNPPKVDFIIGGWPCQDITMAGKMKGINGERSGLFFRMVDIAKKAKAHTLIGENVPYLLSIRKGKDFLLIIETLKNAGFPYISWRTLNAREFGLPQQRRRVFIIASKDKNIAKSIHRRLIPANFKLNENNNQLVAGFYWTAGGRRSICWSEGYMPTLKVGAADNKGRCPTAVYFYESGRVRKITPEESLRLQGFNPDLFEDISPTDKYRMAGNAVPSPVGKFIVETAFLAADNPRSNAFKRGIGIQTGFINIAKNGFYDSNVIWEVEHPIYPLATNLSEFVDEAVEGSLSAQAAAGLICRSIRGGKMLPLALFDSLWELSKDRSKKIIPSRSNSFEILDNELDPHNYREFLILKAS